MSQSYYYHNTKINSICSMQRKIQEAGEKATKLSKPEEKVIFCWKSPFTPSTFLKLSPDLVVEKYNYLWWIYSFCYFSNFLLFYDVCYNQNVLNFNLLILICLSLCFICFKNCHRRKKCPPCKECKVSESYNKINRVEKMLKLCCGTKQCWTVCLWNKRMLLPN